MLRNRTILLLCAIGLLASACGTDKKQPTAGDKKVQAVQRIIEGLDMQVGVAWASEEGEISSVNNEEYPLMSVFKLPVAAAVLYEMQQAGTPLNQKVHVTAAEMLKETYSPLLKIYPDQDFDITVEDLMHYCLAESDNNAADILIRYGGGLDTVRRTLKQMGLDYCRIEATEAAMMADRSKAYDNSATPSQTVALMRDLFQSGRLKEPYLSFLKQTMRATVTGKEKVAAGLPEGAVWAHKTGSSGPPIEGRTLADNDAGFVTLPDGRIIYLAVFIKNSAEPDSVRANVFQTVARTIVGEE